MVDTDSELELTAASESSLADLLEDALKLEPPKGREECRDGIRPCPWVMCRSHLLLRQNARGALRVDGAAGRPGAPPTWPMHFEDTQSELERVVRTVDALANAAETCALDAIERKERMCATTE